MQFHVQYVLPICCTLHLVIIPLLESVQQTVNKLSTVAIEVIVINDSSTDNTGTLLSENNTLYDQLISTRKKSGKGGAVMEGLKQSTGDYILFQDGFGLGVGGRVIGHFKFEV